MMPGKWAFCSRTSTMCDGSGNGSGRKSTPLTTVKIAVLAPIPSARVKMATAAKPAFLMRTRTPYLKSCHKVRIRLLLPRPQPCSRSRLLVTQRDQWIHLRRAPRRKIRRHGRNHGENCRHTYKRERVRRANAVELALQKTHCYHRGDQSRNQAESCQTHAVAHNHVQNVSALSPERHADPDLV